MRILALEPYYGGSHREVLDGLIARLDVDVDLLTLPARKWKWRMRGAAVNMSGQIRNMAEQETRGVGPWDLVYASTFVNLAELYGMAGVALSDVPSIVYFHENQLVYPNRHEAEWDFQFPLTNITSALAADACLFNSAWTMTTFIEEIPGFIRRFPDHHPKGIDQLISAKSRVLAPPFDTGPFDRALPVGAVEAPRGPRARIVWPHRWEHDKDPETFFGVISDLADEGLDFEVAIAGQQFTEVPECIQLAGSHLGDRLAHMGEPETRDEYAALLAGSDVAVSTARNEFFGLAMIEAAYAGCYPLVPDRLAYPELYPAEMRYSSADQLRVRLRSMILERPRPGQGRGLAELFTFDRLVPEYERVFREVAQKGRR